MTYKPGIFRGEVTPENIQRYLEEELSILARDQAESQVLELRPIHAAPPRPREGMIVYADGTDWNPGQGEGVYVYRGGAWWLFEANATALPRFHAYNSATDLNQTGDGTVYSPVEFDTELFDTTNAYASNVFTAGVAGEHFFFGGMRLEGLGASHTTNATLATTLRSYPLITNNGTNVATAGGNFKFLWGVVADMNVGNTASVSVTVSGGAGTVDVAGGAASSLLTHFGGFLIR